MMHWIDLYAAPLLVLLFMAAVGGFFVFRDQRIPLLPRGETRHRTPIARWLWIGAAALLTMVGISWCVVQLVKASSGNAAQCWACIAGKGLDYRVQAWVETQGQAAWLPAVRLWTHLADVAWMAVLSVVVAAWLAVRRYWLILGAWAVGTAGIGLWIRLLKNVVERERPDMQWVLEQGYSFPSGHSAGVVVCYGLLAWIIWLTCKRASAAWLALLAIFMALSIGGTRVLLGVHYVSDVCAGWMLGLAWLSWVIGVAHWLQKERKPSVG